MDRQLQNGGVLIFFPAGEVSRITRRGIHDKKWHSGFIKLAAKYRAPLLPAWIEARNSTLFYASALVSQNLPMLLLMQQMFRRRNSNLPVTIGEQIAWTTWCNPQTTPREMTDKCYRHVQLLGKGRPGVFKTESAIARPEPRALLKRELHQAECLGRTADGKVIYLWQRNGQEEVPLLRELGRLREIAFRAVGEGSGKRRDIDSYDDDYLHLILWDEDDLEIVGAYRFMPTALQMEKRGLDGIYSYSLFHYDERMDDILQHG
ncbi:TPA: lysophospholipid acyltransferase family protein, partial [Klebsiella pneumoniae]